ncbi:hypothetical protein [Cupriavidus sp. CuC1]|uniref:hypothetical protein n=1 Tax=Cupriavidus sp. CuC1 TaxID=3373131 RepID=UPI0037CF4DF6
MQTIKQLFKAGIPTLVSVRGAAFVIQTADQGNNLEVDFMQAGSFAYRVMAVGSGFKARPVLGFDGLTITATVDTNVQFIVTDGDIDLQVTSTSVNVANPSLPVSNSASPFHVTVDGTVNVSGATLTATNVGINNTGANPVPMTLAASQTPATVAPVAVAANTAGTVLLAADAGRRAVRFYNPASSAGPVAITPDNTTTYAQAAIVLNPGDFWNETEAPGAAWYASTPAGTGAAVNLQTVKA